MDEFTLPSTESSSLSSEGSGISQNPNIPCSCEHNFNEERVREVGPSMQDTLQNIGASRPINAQVAPDTIAEAAHKKQMDSNLIRQLTANEA